MSYIPTLSQTLSHILRGLDECAICHFVLDLSFPHDFPDEWKFCCRCLKLANLAVNPFVSIEVLRTLPTFKRIEKKITLVGK